MIYAALLFLEGEQDKMQLINKTLGNLIMDLPHYIHFSFRRFWLHTKNMKKQIHRVQMEIS